MSLFRESSTAVICYLEICDVTLTALNNFRQESDVTDLEITASSVKVRCKARHLYLQFDFLRSSHEIGRGYPGRGLYLELERGSAGDFSPPSDNVIFDNQCYATTPSSSNGNSDMEQANQHYGRRRLHRQVSTKIVTWGINQTNAEASHFYLNFQNSSVNSTPGSPTSRLLLEYEMHLRNTLAKGMDAESYSLHTFEALLTQSMENLGIPFKELNILCYWHTFSYSTDYSRYR